MVVQPNFANEIWAKENEVSVKDFPKQVSQHIQAAWFKSDFCASKASYFDKLLIIENGPFWESLKQCKFLQHLANGTTP